ncbi:MAG: DedA family protein [Candidatus Melainabacteria bacterium]|nr:DedA family protein [Candidatus Melainabacteria bacterium]
MEIDLKVLIQNIGYAGIFGIVFAESGLFFGCFLPGDSLLFMAGFLASQGLFSMPILLIGCFLAAVLGDNVGYAFGHKFGRKLFQKEDSFFFRKENLLKTEDFYKKHGAKTIVIARFIPIIRTFAPIVAGLAAMEYKTFLRYNLIGGVLWGVGVTSAGYFLGKIIPNAEHYLLPIVIGIVIVSVIPAIIHYCQEKLAAKS